MTYVDAAVVALIGLVVVGGWRFLVRAVKREMESVIKQVVSPELERIHQRIDEHMESEEGDLKRLIDLLADLSGSDSDEIRGRIRGR
jgi:hypothetical protein